MINFEDIYFVNDYVLIWLSYQESHGRTVALLTRTDENLTASLLNVTALENSLSAAGEKFIFMQKLREFVSVVCDFLQVWILCFISYNFFCCVPLFF